MKTTQPTKRGKTQWTIAPLLAASSDPVRPEWIRLPKSGNACRYTSLNRSILNFLVLPSAANGYNPPVRSVALRKKGAAKGVRLIHLQSLLDYLESQKP